MTLTFYTNPNSRGRIVRWMLEELGCDYDTVVLDYQRSSEADKWGGAARSGAVATCVEIA